MVTRGRNICNTLKAIRKQIADANGINYSPEECHFEGECKGTCPKCEQDVRDLEYELHLRQMAGKAIKVAGVALGITALPPPLQVLPQSPMPRSRWCMAGYGHGTIDVERGDGQPLFLGDRWRHLLWWRRAALAKLVHQGVLRAKS